jgi:hypothetical protein
MYVLNNIDTWRGLGYTASPGDESNMQTDTAVQLKLSEISVSELEQLVPQLVLDYADSSDAELEEDFVLYEGALEQELKREEDLEKAKKLMIVARCVLTAAYRRGLKFAMAEVHKSRPASTC